MGQVDDGGAATPGYTAIVVINGHPWEYFCNGCGQLRLTYNPCDEHSRCAHCMSADLIRGKCGELDKALLTARRTPGAAQEAK